ncbi:hypothetical protein [Evansella cellulosilytica]|uniref:Uncharacterized protein n=1 Tax=Evansella cellulosilytica (strain ATCC 21833 / DSM 2522 / FERM P-1141 / JCM 9156 / N-4) TaxID=649639 RepID=E6TYZ8_EVAC2|nr:hypothetical protein [Evansella cellulosilytica]ADU32441.1 hypothetical protein Bcell_4214 [Evansella cellulosilytica DSM 2522]
MMLFFIFLCLILYWFTWYDLKRKKSRIRTYVVVFSALTVISIFSGIVLIVDTTLMPSPNEVLYNVYGKLYRLLSLTW